MIKLFSVKADGNRQLSVHFKVREFRCKDGSDVIFIDDDLIPILESLYVNLNASAINITSGYRTPDHSVKVGGYRTDKHTQGRAVDIKIKDKNGKYITAEKILCCYESLGYQGGAGFINRYSVHIDTRSGVKKWFIEPKMTLVGSWYRYFGKDKPNYTLVKSVDKNNLNIRNKPQVSGNKPCFTVPYGTRFLIDSFKGTFGYSGSWCHIAKTDYWITGSSVLVNKVV